MIVVTGGAGFIGSNLVKALNQRVDDDIVVVDDLTNGHKFTNLSALRIADYLDKDRFATMLRQNDSICRKLRGIFHQGACSTTTAWDGRYMMENNYEYSKQLLHFAAEQQIPFIYASSAAVYGGSEQFRPIAADEKPLNVYGYSKLQFDHYVRRYVKRHQHGQVVGLRYFNVYGPGEAHKGTMASVAWHFYNQLQSTGILKLFAGHDGYADGEQRRDFVFVEDVVAVILWFWANPHISGVFNVGTGRSQSFNEMADALLTWRGYGEISYVPFPEHLKGHYQSFTQADMTALRQVGCEHPFADVTSGVQRYMTAITAPAND